MPKWLLKRPGRCLNIKDLRGGEQPRHTFLFKYKHGGGEHTAAAAAANSLSPLCYIFYSLFQSFKSALTGPGDSAD